MTLQRPGAGLSTGSGTVGGARVIAMDEVRHRFADAPHVRTYASVFFSSSIAAKEVCAALFGTMSQKVINHLSAPHVHSQACFSL